jgi:hypothetical protein
MNRRTVILTWLMASAMPLVLAMALLGCCALPFHATMHKVVPCGMAEMALTPQPQDHGGHGGHDQPAAPPAQKHDGQDGTRFVWKLAWKSEARQAAPLPMTVGAIVDVPRPPADRSQIALGAARCDDDVGTRLALLDTLRI